MQHDPGSGVWLLRGEESCYALRVDRDGQPRHLHWGPPLTLEQAAAIPPRPRLASSFDEQDGVREYPAEGGAWFGPPALRVRPADGGPAPRWRNEVGVAGADGLRLRLVDAAGGLVVELNYRVRGDVVERWATVVNTAKRGAPAALLRVDSAAWSLPARADYRLSHATGGWNTEGTVRRTPLPVGETTLTSRRGVSSHHAAPWVMLDAGDAGEEHGEVWSGALAWSGSWRITAHRDHQGRAGFTGGAGHEGLTVALPPGGVWRTPVFAGVFSPHGFGGVSRVWHRHLARHVLPAPSETRPVLYNSWEATGFAVDEAGQRDLAERAAALGAELFVLDDGWFGARVDDRAGLGDWAPNPERFPDGLRPLAEHVRGLGMSFGLWVEPEMVNPDSDLHRARPDWVLRDGPRPVTLRHQLVLDFGRAEVADWAFGWLDRLVAEVGVDFLKWDMNRAFADAGRPGAEHPDHLWFDHVHGLYAVLDRLRAAHPDLRIESCAGGGGRADLGVLARTDQVWTSDNTDPVDRIGIQRGHTQVLSARTMSAWVTDSPNPLTGRVTPLRFRFHLAMTGVLGLGGDLRGWSAADLAEAADLVALYKSIRDTVQLGVLHRLADAVQYTRDDEVVVVAWRVGAHYGTPPLPLRLVGLDPAARYADQDTGATHHGAVLLAHGLHPDLPHGEHASALVRLRKH